MGKFVEDEEQINSSEFDSVESAETVEANSNDNSVENKDAVESNDEACESKPASDVVKDNAESDATAVESDEDLESLEEKRNVVDGDADQHRRLRDEYNAHTKEWKAKRDNLNMKVRGLIDEAGKCREERDANNQKVKESKVSRDECNKKVIELKKQLAEMRPQRDKSNDKNEVPLGRLKNDLDQLEKEFETRSHSSDKEKEMVKQISKLAAQIRDREQSMENIGEVREVANALREAKAEAEGFHHQMSEYADLAQTSHDRMLKLYDEADAFRKEADEAQTKFVEYKKAADEEHKKYIDSVKSIHEMDRGIGDGKRKRDSGRRKSVDNENKIEATKIYERFKNGEKLSTEDLMILQKTGFL